MAERIGTAVLELVTDASGTIRSFSSVRTEGASVDAQFEKLRQRAKQLGPEMGAAFTGASPAIGRLRDQVRGLDAEAGRAAKGGLGSMASVLGTFRTILPALGVASAVSGLMRLNTTALDNAGALIDMSNATGLSTDTLQEMQAVAKQTGTSLETFSNAAYRLGVNIATGSAQARDSIRDLNLEYAAIKSASPDEQFRMVVTALEGVDNAQERNRIGTALFGKQFKEISAAIEGGYSRIADAAGKSSRAQLEALDRAGDKWDEFKTEFQRSYQGMLATFVQGIADIERAADSLSIAQKASLFVRSGGGGGVYLNELKAMGQALREAEDAQRKQNQTAGTAAAAQTDYVAKLRTFRAEVAGLTSAQKAQIDAAAKTGDINKEFADSLGVSIEAIRLYQSEAKGGTKDTNEFTKALQQFGGGDAIKRANELTKVLGALGGPLKVLPDQLAAMAKEYERAAVAARLIGDVRAAEDFALMARTLQPLILLQQRYNVTLGQFITKSDDYTAAVHEQIDANTDAKDTLYFGIIPSLNLATQAWEQYKGAVQSSSEATADFEGPDTARLSAMADEMQQTMQSLIGIAIDAIETGDFENLGEDIGTAVGSGIGAAIGQYYGGAGGAQAGSQIGGFFGRFIAEIVDVWTTNAGDHGERLGRHFGGRFSEAFGEEIGQVANDMFNGDVFAAGIYRLSSAIDELGGITAQNLPYLTARLRDVFVMLETGVFNVNQAIEVLDENWRAFVEAGTDGNGELSEGLREIIRLARQFNVVSDEMADYIREQADAAIEGVNAVIGYLTQQYDEWQRLTDAVTETREAIAKLNETPLESRGREWQADMDAAQARLASLTASLLSAGAAVGDELETLGFIALGVYNAAIAAGKTHAEALRLAQPGLERLATIYEQLGIKIEDAGLAALLMQSRILSRNPALIAGIEGMTQAIIAMGNNQTLTAETLARMQTAIASMYTRVQGEVAALGGTTIDALRPMQPLLHAAERAARRLGVALDANIQRMIDQSRQEGIWVEDAETIEETMAAAMQSMTKATGTLTKSINEMVNALRGIPPRVRTEIEIHTVRTSSGDPAPDDLDPNDPSRNRGGPGFRNGIFRGNFDAAGELRRLHGVESIVPRRDELAFASRVLAERMTPATSAAGTGFGTTVVPFAVFYPDASGRIDSSAINRHLASAAGIVGNQFGLREVIESLARGVFQREFTRRG